MPKAVNERPYLFSARLWVYPGMAGWHFITVPKDISEKIKSRFGQSSKGWGSLPVEVKLGKTIWKTSIFPDRKAGACLLPIKAEVRKKEDLAAKDDANITLMILI